MNTTRRGLIGLAVLACTLLLASPAQAIFHTFRIVEMYSSVDGSVQYIKFQEQFNFGSQNIWGGVTLTCEDAANPGTLNSLTFPNNLPSSATASKFVLVATANFASLTGGITPDYVMPANFLFRGGGTLNFGGVQVLAYAALPSNGQSAQTAAGATVANAPRNFAGASGSVNLPAGSCCVGSACSLTIQLSCTGTWTSGSCSPNPCAPATGTCCAGATCRVVVAASCTGPNTTFRSSSSACNAGGSAVNPCCFADYNQVGGATVGDIFEFLNEWFAQSPRADMVGNGTGMPEVGSIFAFLNAWFAGGC